MGVAAAFNAAHRVLPPVDDATFEARVGGRLRDGSKTILDGCMAEGRWWTATRL